MLESLKRLLGLEKLPRETERIFREAKDEEDAVRRLRAEKGRMVRHRERTIEDIGVLEAREKELMDEGRRAESPIRREVLARQVAEIRDQAAAFLNRVDLLTRKIAVFDRHLDLLKDRGILTGPLPGPELLERTAGDVDAARRELEDLIELGEATDGVNRLRAGGSSEEDVVREMEGKTPAASSPSFDDLVERHTRKRRASPSRESEPPIEGA